MKTSSRKNCTRCLRPTSHCLCAWISPVSNHTKVVVLQHPDEYKHPLNTGRLAVLGLANAELLVGEDFPQLAEIIATVQNAFILFPAQEGSVVQPLVPTNQQQSSLLIVPDGTWRNVRKIMLNNPILAALPHISLPAGEPSQYRIRKASEPAAVATIEAIFKALTDLEPQQDFSCLLAPFHTLIEQQIQAMGADVYRRNYKA